MKQSKKELIEFSELERRRQLQRYGQYECFATLGRLEGYCELLICERGKQRGELFSLSFSQKGMTGYTQLYQRMQIEAWLDGHECNRITYFQALGLLGDAVRQNYKYRMDSDQIHNNPSLHLQRIWSPEFYNDINSSLSWVLCRQDIQTILRAYLRAIGNKDAVLLYELHAEQSRDGQTRNAYVLRWNHVLEDWCIFDFQILTCIENNKKEEDVTFFLTTYCEGKEQQVISVDMCLRVIREKGYFRILTDRVLEARYIYKGNWRK